VVLAVAIAGCHSGVISVRQTGDSGPPVDGSVAAAMFFSTRVEPMLAGRCGGCHLPGRTGPDFLRGSPDVRTTLLEYPALVDLESPRTSRLLTKGEHDGPALPAGDAELVRTWIEMEAAEGTHTMPRPRELATTPAGITPGFNVLALDGLGVDGTVIHFVATRVGGGMFLDGMEIVAGPTGAHLEHPVLVTWYDGMATPDPIDRFSTLDVDVPPNSTVSFDSGTVALTDFPEFALLSIHFDVVEPVTMVMPDEDAGMPMPMPSDGCTQLDAFRAMASPALGANCTRCHGGANAQATAAVDMTRVRATSDAELLLGCNQILGRISTSAPSSSGLFIQPDPAAGGTHPFKFGTTTEMNNFRSQILGWFEMETP
jgi:hypothetical protein